jgi:NADH dehydrogenase
MIFLTGATGFVGSNLLRDLLKDGYKVTCLIRDRNRGRKIEEIGASVCIGDILNIDSLIKGMEGADTVIHLVGIIYERKESTFYKIHYEGTKNIIDAMKSLSINRYIHMSALGTRKNAKSNYHRTKFLAEEYVRNSGVNYTIFRPSIIYGEGDQFINMLVKMVKFLPIIPIIGSGKNLLQPININNISQYFIGAIGNKKTNSKTYEIGGPDRISFEELIRLISDILNKKRLHIHIPSSLMKINAIMMEKILPKSLITKDQLMMIEEDNICDIEDTLNDFNVDLIPLKEGLRNYIKLYKRR